MSEHFGKNWLAALEARFGQVTEIGEIKAQGQPRIRIFYFAHFPERGMLTAVTCGLSDAAHPDWKAGKPELMISLETRERDWGASVAYLASHYFNKQKFFYGDLFRVDAPLSKESPMTGCFIYAPSFLNPAEARFELPDRVVHLSGVYPLYDDEVEIARQYGIDKIWRSEAFQLYQPQRDHVTLTTSAP